MSLDPGVFEGIDHPGDLWADGFDMVSPFDQFPGKDDRVMFGT